MFLAQFWELYVADMKKSADFYQNVLGFKLRRTHDDFVDLDCGNLKIHLCRKEDWVFCDDGKEAASGTVTACGKYVEFVLVSQDIEGAYNQALESGWPISEPLTKQPWGKTDFRIFDPDGCYIRVTTERYAENSF